MKRIGKLIVGLYIMSVCQVVKGQDPEWSVDYSQFQFRMSVSAMLELEGIFLQQGENKVAAFVGGEIRGLGYANLFHEPTGRYLAVFQIGSNLPTGEEVVFQLYGEVDATVVEARKKISFEADKLLGSIGTPYIISDNRHPTAVSVSSTTLEEEMRTGQIISEISVADEDDDAHVFTLSGFEPEEAAALIQIDGSNIVVAQAANYEELNSFAVVLTATDPLGAVFSSEIDFTITERFEVPNVTPVLDDHTFKVHEDATEGTVLGKVVAYDEDVDQHLSYEIIDHEEQIFTISASDGEMVLNHSDVLDYEQTAFYLLKVVVSDDGVPSLSDTAMVQIAVQDVQDKELLIRNYISPNGDGFNDFLTIENVEIYPGFELKILNSRGVTLYHRVNYDNTWDGYYRGDVLPTGVYYYLFENSESHVQYAGKLYIKDR
ncbi:gliding motility-associated C-terminal domain-containing protein [Reichenbachiella agarivorans]|uniref:Gliding motility-associated C-terminal domain-containing protein n=1 Tax=Reichenbachiella agarivorans TaxID=2979464 RepID=A0ABY6CTU4_9BACT|nr:gliding motility-associated C-terminal domain-containing protein [Reichenbachiella agarivorans]UXP33942.1 gliding motility-associated C-terminal domain-containing protein [Reichenbachiella agarivorans]